MSCENGSQRQIGTSGVRPECSSTCTIHTHVRPERPETDATDNSADGRFVRPERDVSPERTSASQIAELSYREADELPNVESRMRVAKALRDLLATFRMSVTRFAALHDVNEKQASKWLDGRANYPAWGFDPLPEDMSEALYASVRAGKSEGRYALRSRITRLNMAEALEASRLVNDRIAALAGGK